MGEKGDLSGLLLQRFPVACVWFVVDCKLKPNPGVGRNGKDLFFEKVIGASSYERRIFALLLKMRRKQQKSIYIYFFFPTTRKNEKGIHQDIDEAP